MGQKEGEEMRAGSVVVGGDGDTFDSGGVGHAAELQAVTKPVTKSVPKSVPKSGN